MTIGEMQQTTENQTFDRKSIRVEPKGLSNIFVAFANADGGIIVIGIEDKTKEIEGILGYEAKLNEIYRVGYDFCVPSVKCRFEKVDCIDKNGEPNQLLLICVEQSDKVHANQADEVYYRVGDKSKKLSFEERMQLIYDKGEMLYENAPVINASIEDIDISLVESYIKLIDYQKSAMEFLTEAKAFVVKDKITVGAILLFGKNPQKFFPRARIRFIKYQGTEEKTGAEMNVIKDVVFEGTIYDVLKKTIEFVGAQIKDFTRLTKGGLFATTPEYPEFVWNEIIVNAVCHRDYSISGTDIHVKMFDDKIIVESPGGLPGLVRLNNIRNTHFSRNPKIAEYLKIYHYVKEFGEGVDRMCLEMSKIGLPEPEYSTVGFMTKVVVRNNYNEKDVKKPTIKTDVKKPTIKTDDNKKEIVNYLKLNLQGKNKDFSELLDLKSTRIKEILYEMIDENIIIAEGSKRNRIYKLK